MFDHSTYLSPLTWRYGSDEMRQIWSEEYKRRVWRRIWVALAEVQAELGLVTPQQVNDLRAHAADVDMERAHEIEAEIKHDLMAEVKAFAEQCPLGGGIIHLGATSMDIEDNAEALRLRAALDLLIERLRSLLALLAARIEARADQVCMGYTHLQPAEPTTVGYRLAQYGQDLFTDLEELQRVRDQLRGKGFKGATGTSASYSQLLASPTANDGVLQRGATSHAQELPSALPTQDSAAGRVRDFEARLMAKLALPAFTVTTQVYPRKQDWLALNALSGLAGSLYRFAFDVRILQSQPFGEWGEPFASRQVGSSAMPFKRNPIHSENIDSLARWMAALPRVAWDNMAHSLLERTLDDSANRRFLFPEACLIAEELLRRAHHILSGLIIYDGESARKLATYGSFSATERLLMELVKAGADRQAMHEVIRRHSLVAWEALRRDAAETRTIQGDTGAEPRCPTGPNPVIDLLATDPAVLAFLPAEQVRTLLDASEYVGDAAQRAREMASLISSSLEPAAVP